MDILQTFQKAAILHSIHNTKDEQHANGTTSDPRFQQ